MPKITPPAAPERGTKSPGAKPAARPPRNRRLPPDERREQILDAALHEFSERGFGAARMDDIAARAGLSKGGLYAHFASKKTVFEALMQRMLLPDLLFDARVTNPPMTDAAARPPLDALVDAFLDGAYARLDDSRFLQTLHLLIAEGPRMADVIEGWRTDHLQLLHRQQAALQQAVEQGVLRESALTDMVQLIHAPILLAAILKMLQGEGHVRAVVPRLQAAHRRLLLELLPPES